MKKRLIVLCQCFAVFSALLVAVPVAIATPDGPHNKLRCTECHSVRPAAGGPVSFVTGDSSTLCAKCHASSHNSMLAVAAVSVKSHSSTAAIPEAMKQQMIQWLSSHNYPAYGDPLLPWTLSCNSCHTMHGAPYYPVLLRYNMENGGLCTFCHGGLMNIASDWQQATARRVIFGPTHLGLRQTDGTEVPAPAFPKDNDLLSGVVNFPLAVLTGDHRTTTDIAYRISIPGSVFNVREVNPASHMYWAYQTDMVTWDTRLETNKPYTVTITPFDPVTLAEGAPVSIYVLVRN